MNKNYDVVVIGGGPAGSSASALIAEKGHTVLILEREIFPRFKIGESLMPGTYWTLERIGMLDKMRRSHFPLKYSVQFYRKSGDASAPFYFFQNDPHESSQTWQVLRSEFDQLLIDNAKEKGAEVLMGMNVSQVLFDGEKAVGVQARDRDGNVHRFGATVVLDASGQTAILSRQLKISVPEPKLKKAAVFSHFEGALRDPGIDEGATLVVHTRNEEGWFWYIPLPRNVVSVGVVGSIDYLVTNRKNDLQRIFDEEVELAPEIKRRIEGSKQLFPMKTTKDFSYRSTKIAGHNWILAGDAFGFLDPIYSSGVLLALKSGEFAADVIHEGFEKNDFSPAQLGKYGPFFAQGMEAVRRLVYAFYTRNFSFAEFLKKYPETRQDIIHILSGNVFRVNVDALFPSLGTMADVPEDRALKTDEEASVATSGSTQ
ncbi:tryptophan 7-halogenase [bacterium]|nr:tryptophan 7-halogenase [bacterium]